MPVYDHTGAPRKLVGPDGRTYAVYVMGPSGLITIDPGAAFSPAAGSYTTYDEGVTQFTLNCTVPATWTYSRTNTAITATVASGGSATSITFSLNTGGSVTKPTSRSGTVTVTGSVGGVSASYTINMQVVPLL